VSKLFLLEEQQAKALLDSIKNKDKKNADSK